MLGPGWGAVKTDGHSVRSRLGSVGPSTRLSIGVRRQSGAPNGARMSPLADGLCRKSAGSHSPRTAATAL